MGLVSIDKGDLNLYIEDNVTRVAFADHSGAANWGTGKFKVSEGFANGEMGFGTNASGLTAANVDNIVLVNKTGVISINAQGLL